MVDAQRFRGGHDFPEAGLAEPQQLGLSNQLLPAIREELESPCHRLHVRSPRLVRKNEREPSLRRQRHLRVSETAHDDPEVQAPFLDQGKQFLPHLLVTHSTPGNHEEIGGGRTRAPPVSGAVQHACDRAAGRQQGLQDTPLHHPGLAGRHALVVHLVSAQQGNLAMGFHGRIIDDAEKPRQDPGAQLVQKRVVLPGSESAEREKPGTVRHRSRQGKQSGHQDLIHQFRRSLSLKKHRPVVAVDEFRFPALNEAFGHGLNLSCQFLPVRQILPSATIGCHEVLQFRPIDRLRAG